MLSGGSCSGVAREAAARSAPRARPRGGRGVGRTDRGGAPCASGAPGVSPEPAAAADRPAVSPARPGAGRRSVARGWPRPALPTRLGARSSQSHKCTLSYPLAATPVQHVEIVRWVIPVRRGRLVRGCLSPGGHSVRLDRRGLRRLPSALGLGFSLNPMPRRCGFSSAWLLYRCIVGCITYRSTRCRYDFIMLYMCGNDMASLIPFQLL